MQYLITPSHFPTFSSGKHSRQGSRTHSPQPSSQLSRQFSFGTIPDPEANDFEAHSEQAASTEESGSEKVLGDESEHNLSDISRRKARFGSCISGLSQGDTEDDLDKSRSSSTSRGSSKKSTVVIPQCTISPSALVFGGDVSQEQIKKHAIDIHSGLRFANSKISSALKGLVLSKTVTLSKKTNKFNRTLVLDLDETLITTKKDENDHDAKIAGTEFELKIRPFADEFIKKMSKEFEIIVFSSADRRYVEAVVKVLDPKRQYISHVFHREHCIKTPQGVFVKDLRIFKGRELRDMIIVDNLVQSFCHQIENGIPILSWYGDRKDQELKYLMEYLKEARRSPDMRTFNRKRLQLLDLATITLEEFLNN